MTVTGAEPSTDDVLPVVSSAKRRKLLVSLIADSPPDSTTPTAVDAPVDGTMHHLHLPKLADYGFIVWEKNSNTIRKGPHFEATEELLEFLAERDEALPTGEVAL